MRLAKRRERAGWPLADPISWLSRVGCLPMIQLRPRPQFGDGLGQAAVQELAVPIGLSRGGVDTRMTHCSWYAGEARPAASAERGPRP
jgi:hypothetical protein